MPRQLWTSITAAIAAMPTPSAKVAVQQCLTLPFRRPEQRPEQNGQGVLFRSYRSGLSGSGLFKDGGRRSQASFQGAHRGVHAEHDGGAARREMEDLA